MAALHAKITRDLGKQMLPDWSDEEMIILGTGATNNHVSHNGPLVSRCVHWEKTYVCTHEVHSTHEWEAHPSQQSFHIDSLVSERIRTWCMVFGDAS